MKSFAVIGLGRFGTIVATSLYNQGADVLAVDTAEEHIQAVADHVTRAVIADATNKDVLKSLGVAECDAAIVGIASDLAASVLITMHLKSLGVPIVVCKAYDDTHREILEKLGADRVILPERVIAEKTAASLISPNILEFIELSNDYGILECQTPASLAEKRIIDLNVRAKYGVTILAIKQGEKVNVSPSAADTIGAGSTLVLLGKYDALEKFQALK